MKVLFLAVALLSASGLAEDNLAHRQQAINRLLYRVNEPLLSSFTDLKELATTWDPRAHVGHCSDEGAAVDRIMTELEQGRLRGKKQWFSLFNPRQREEALMLIHVLLSCKDFQTFKGNAAFFRERMNEGEFVYALYVSVTHSKMTQEVILPPLYEVTPHMFTNSEVIQKAYEAKMLQTPGRFRMTFTGTLKNTEQRVAYFGEDIGMNSHHVHWHMDFPFWWDGEHIDRKGELFFWAHHQLTARFDSERLSNHLPIVDELHWDRPIDEGFAPHTVYKYGGEFPTRPDNLVFEDVAGVARIRDLKEIDERIRDSIARGFVYAANGTVISLKNERGIDILGNMIESSTYSVNEQYYGSLHNQAHRVLGAQSDPVGKFKMPPGVMEHFETATRDPAFFRLHKYMDNIFKEHKDSLPPYSKKDLEYDNVLVTYAEVSELVTFFEDFEFDLTNAFDSTEDLVDVPVSAYVSRLNHKPFTFDIYADAKRDDSVTVRIHICPRFDSNGLQIPFDNNRWRCIELDKFWTKVTAGENHIVRNSSESSVTIPDRIPFKTLMQQADEAVASNTDLPHNIARARGCGLPQRLLLPKGTKTGMQFWLFVGMTSGDDGVHDDLLENTHGNTHSNCGIHGLKYPDKRPMGFPFDRRIPDFRNFIVGNFLSTVVMIYHKDIEEL
ncbi:hemocyanin-like [Penaeus indicus]|uniref:hemocyanin-like n=1 Tax=Penaeus indicus TaxID=29960 RepID=UPI00300C3EA6